MLEQVAVLMHLEVLFFGIWEQASVQGFEIDLCLLRLLHQFLHQFLRHGTPTLAELFDNMIQLIQAPFQQERP